MIALGLTLQVAVFCAVAAAFLAHRSASAFHPLLYYLIFHLLAFVVRPLLVHLAGFDGQWRYMGFTPTPEGFVRALAVASVALVCFAAASLTAGTVRPLVDDPEPAANVLPRPASAHRDVVASRHV